MANNPSPTLLDQNQILQRSFDETKDRLRVETEIATVTIAGGSQEILITDDVDSIKIGDGLGTYAKVKTDGVNNALVVTQNSQPLPTGAATSANQTNGTQKTQKVDASGNIEPAGDTNVRGIHIIPGDGTNLQTYTAAGEAKVLVTPLTNSSVVKAQLQDNAGNGLTSQLNGTQHSLDVGINVSGIQIDPRIKQESVLASAGQMFSACLNSTPLSGTTETPLLLISNPNASGKSVYLYSMDFSPTLGNNYVTYRIYKDATVTANGSVVTISGNRTIGQASSVINLYSGPTISSNGILVKNLVASGLSGIDASWGINFSFIIDPNHNILITRQLSANATAGGVDVSWAEQ